MQGDFYAWEFSELDTLIVAIASLWLDHLDSVAESYTSEINIMCHVTLVYTLMCFFFERWFFLS
jgi:hypothetical protein